MRILIIFTFMLVLACADAKLHMSDTPLSPFFQSLFSFSKNQTDLVTATGCQKWVKLVDDADNRQITRIASPACPVNCTVDFMPVLMHPGYRPDAARARWQPLPMNTTVDVPPMSQSMTYAQARCVCPDNVTYAALVPSPTPAASVPKVMANVGSMPHVVLVHVDGLTQSVARRLPALTTDRLNVDTWDFPMYTATDSTAEQDYVELLTGQDTSRVGPDLRTAPIDFDFMDFLWKAYKRRRYRIAYAADHCLRLANSIQGLPRPSALDHTYPGPGCDADSLTMNGQAGLMVDWTADLLDLGAPSFVILNIAQSGIDDVGAALAQLYDMADSRGDMALIVAGSRYVEGHTQLLPHPTPVDAVWAALTADMPALQVTLPRDYLIEGARAGWGAALAARQPDVLRARDVHLTLLQLIGRGSDAGTENDKWTKNAVSLLTHTVAEHRRLAASVGVHTPLETVPAPVGGEFDERATADIVDGHLKRVLGLDPGAVLLRLQGVTEVEWDGYTVRRMTAAYDRIGDAIAFVVSAPDAEMTVLGVDASKFDLHPPAPPSDELVDTAGFGVFVYISVAVVVLAIIAVGKAHKHRLAKREPALPLFDVEDDMDETPIAMSSRGRKRKLALD